MRVHPDISNIQQKRKEAILRYFRKDGEHTSSPTEAIREEDIQTPEPPEKQSLWNKIFGKKQNSPPATQNKPGQKGKADKQKKVKPKWSMSRIIWRAGELNITEVLPYLIEIEPSPNSMQNYALAWTLGRIGNAEAIPLLNKLINYDKDNPQSQKVIRIARHSLAMISQRHNNIHINLKPDIPQGLKELIASGYAEVDGYRSGHIRRTERQ